MSTTGELRVFPFLGNPIAQAKTPKLFNALFALHHFAGMVAPMRVSPAHMPDLTRALLRAGNIEALALTNPHKGQMFSMVDRCDPLTRFAGCVNAVRLASDGVLEGAIFDGKGIVKAMRLHGVSPMGQRVLIVGVGQAGRAIAVALADDGAQCIALYDLLEERSVYLAHLLQAAFPVEMELPDTLNPAGYSVIINATPLGTHAHDPLPFDVRAMDRDAIAFDVVAGQQPTSLLNECARLGITAYSGHEMLIQQIPEYLHFFGLEELAHQAELDMTYLRHLIHQDTP